MKEAARLKQRVYRLQGKPVEVSEVEGVYAVRRTDEHDSVRDGKSVSLEKRVPGLRAADVQPFRDAGWTFVMADDLATVRHKESPAKVFIQPSGRIALGIDRLTVQLNGEPDPATAREFLSGQGVQVVQLEPLRFAPGLYSVRIRPSPGKDILDVTNDLATSGEVVFAEPELVEVLAQPTRRRPPVSKSRKSKGSQ